MELFSKCTPILSGRCPTATSRSISRNSWRRLPSVAPWRRQWARRCEELLLFAPLSENSLQLPLFGLRQPGENAFGVVVETNFAVTSTGDKYFVAERRADPANESIGSHFGD